MGSDGSTMGRAKRRGHPVTRKSANSKIESYSLVTLSYETRTPAAPDEMGHRDTSGVVYRPLYCESEPLHTPLALSRILCSHLHAMLHGQLTRPGRPSA